MNTEIRTVDTIIYREELTPWLPPRIVDCHVHIGLDSHCGPIHEERFKEIWALEVSRSQSWAELRQTYKALFPNQQVLSLAFGGVYREVDIAANNDYVREGISNPANRAYGLMVTRPDWDASVLGDALVRGFLGIKPYPDLYLGGGEISIYQFVPRPHLDMLNRLGGILMLHLPRRERLRDPENIRELLDISETYPSIKLIVAHIGRSYCLPTAKPSLSHFIGTENIYFDTSANLNSDVFQYAIETLGPDRILYGSDLPVMLMRGMREHIGDKYINYTDGDYSWNTNRKGPEEESKYTFYIYQELMALIRAAQRAGLGQEAIAKILYSNSAKLLNIDDYASTNPTASDPYRNRRNLSR